MKILGKIVNPKTLYRFAAAFGLFFIAGISFVVAQEAGGEPTEGPGFLHWLALSSGFGLGIAAMGSALGQGRMMASAMEGISRNPEAAKDMFVPMILGLAFIEALTIYALIFVFVFTAAV